MLGKYYRFLCVQILSITPFKFLHFQHVFLHNIRNYTSLLSADTLYPGGRLVIRNRFSVGICNKVSIPIEIEKYNDKLLISIPLFPRNIRKQKIYSFFSENQIIIIFSKYENIYSLLGFREIVK